MQQLARYITPTLIFPVLLVAALCAFIGWYWQVAAPRRGLEWISSHQQGALRPAMTFSVRCHPMVRKDWLILLALTVVYAFTAFFRLGSTVNPQGWTDFADEQPHVVTLSQEIYLTKLMYYTGLGTGAYNVEISTDGENWLTLWTREDEAGNTTYYWADAEGYSPSYAMSQGYADLFKWLEIEPENPQYARYLRITGRADSQVMELGELALYTSPGTGGNAQGLLDIAPGVGGGSADIIADGVSGLFDEQDTVPEQSTWYNSTYFDEIYHARTAYEHTRGIYPYEISHPPLGKLILGLGIRMFGMTPFGWRFMGTLLGVAMVPILYVFLKNLFGKTKVALCGTALFTFDFMHLTQTRIATIDTYAVLFILLMYYFMYRYLVLPAGTSFAKGAPWLALSGLFWGIGAASKWTVIYGGVGLALLYFIGLLFKLRDWPRGAVKEEPAVPLAPWLLKTLGFSVLCFILIPAIIYTLSYLPYAAARGVDLSLWNTLSGMGRSLPVFLHNLWGHFTGGESFTAQAIPQDSLSGIMLNNQWYMLTYHEGVHTPHPYSSRWYQWIVDARPILYYLDSTSVPGFKTAFGAFNNPVVSWGGLLAFITTAVEMVRLRCGKALFIVIAYFSQLAPWFFIGRITFAYHYFPSILFLTFALSYLFDRLLELQPTLAPKPIYALTGTAAGLYAAFYPVLIGLSVPVWYSTWLLRWLPSWPF